MSRTPGEQRALAQIEDALADLGPGFPRSWPWPRSTHLRAPDQIPWPGWLAR